MIAPRCWLNGQVLPLGRARIDPLDRGFTLGDGLFETIAVRDAAPAHLHRHLDRLAQGAAALALACPWPRATIAAAIASLIGHAAQPTAVIRITLTRGPAPRGVLPGAQARPTLLITCADAAPMPDAIQAILCHVTRRNQASPLARLKSLNYLDAILARQEAAAAGAQDAVLLNTRGQIAEASAANLFALRGDALLTPPVADGALPGIARALLIERAGAIEASLSTDDLHRADALILSSSLGLRQITRLDAVRFAPAPALLARLALAMADRPPIP